MRCDRCEMIPLTELKTPADYMTAVEAFMRMEKAGEVERVYENYPLELVFAGMNDRRTKFFHQFRCTKCSTLYGMFVNITAGGEIRINEKVFDPADYPDRKEEG